MGRDKALIIHEGTTLVQRACDALTVGGAMPVVVVGGDRYRVERLGLEYVPDRHLGAGPLGGIITALDHLDADIVVVLACDYVAPSSAAVRDVVETLGSFDVAVPVSDGHQQWLHAAWRRTVLPTLEAAYRRGCRAPRDVADELTTTWLINGDPAWYRDADRPEDLPSGAR
jgi:molybdopterin-guanine dinucleotide biosynthesis protein A